MATRIEESFLRRSASCGRSSMPTTSLASTIVKRLDGAVRSSGCSTSPRPTIARCRSGVSARTSSAAGTATAAPWSPLMASTAMVSRVRIGERADYSCPSSATGFSITFLPR
jgi:hypothetical protein